MKFRISTNKNIKHAGKNVCYFFTASREKISRKWYIMVQSIPITKASKVFNQIFGLVRWFGPPVLLTGGP